MILTTRSRLVAILLVATMGSVSCSESGSEEISGTWMLESADVDGTSLDIDETASTRAFDGVAAWVHLDIDGRLMGEGTCNDFHGSYSFDGEFLRSSDVVASARACDSGQDIENRLLAQLWNDSVAVTLTATDPNVMTWSTSESVMTFARR